MAAAALDSSAMDEERQVPRLSPRQRQVVALLALGYSNDDMAARLGLSPRTVRAHCDVVRVKLGVRHRREIPRAYVRLTGDELFAPGILDAA